MKNQNKDEISEKKIMPKLLHGLNDNDKKSVVNLLRMQANYVYFKHGYGSKKTNASNYATAAYHYMEKSYISMSNTGKNKIKSMDLQKLTPSQKNNWGLLASSYAKNNPTLFSQQSSQRQTSNYQNQTNHQSNDINQKKADFAWNSIMDVAHKQAKQFNYYQKHGFPFNYLINSVRPKDKVPFAHAIMDKSRINYAQYKGYKAYKYQRDFKRNCEYLTPQGLHKFNSLVKTESPKHFNSLGFASANFIKKYNQKHPHNFSIQKAFAKIPDNEKLPSAQYLNDMSKGLYFGFHGKTQLGNSLIDNGKDAKDKLSEDSQKITHNIIVKGLKHHTLGNVGYQAHQFVNNQFKQIKQQHQQAYNYHQQHSPSVTGKVNTHDEKSLSHVNLASKLFGNNKDKKPKTNHHFSGKSNKPELHPKKEQKQQKKLSPKEEQKREKMFSSLNQQGQNQQ